MPLMLSVLSMMRVSTAYTTVSFEYLCFLKPENGKFFTHIMGEDELMLYVCSGLSAHFCSMCGH